MGRPDADIDEDAEDETCNVDRAGRDGGDDYFFESLDRVPSGVSFDRGHLSSSDSDSDDDDDEEDVRMSFASAIEPPRFSVCVPEDCFQDDEGGFDYGIWMADSVSITERRRRFLHGMGLRSSKDLSQPSTSNSFPPPLPPSAPAPPPLPAAQSISSPTLSLTRSLSGSHIPGKAREAAGLVRSLSSPPSPWLRYVAGEKAGWVYAKAEEDSGEACKIKSLDTGKEFVLSEVGTDGSRLNDVQTGLQLTMDEFDRFLGFSPIVKDLMRRVSDRKKNDGGNISSSRRYSVKSSKSGGRKRGSWLKNIKFVASSVTGLISEKERDNIPSSAAAVKQNGNSSDWLKVHQHGKSHKELTGLYMCQEIQAHEGSIWCMRFSSNGRFLASAGEDRRVHVWEVMESDTFSTFSLLRRQESRSTSAVNGSPSSRLDHAKILGSYASKRSRKGGSKLGSRRRSPLPNYVVLPDTVFSISETPVCTFEGHLEDVLDLSWSKSQYLLSSSMDKTVRLWDMESKACLKLFAHNDYVTCIQFNPTNDDYFISGSLDGKVRLWSIPNRQVVDWSDLHEMVTAVCYTPDGQGALVGSHKGSIRFYDTSDDQLSQENQIDIRNKKKKSHAKKITGFQHAPDNSSEVLVTSADSQIRVFDGTKIIHKFKGFRNTSSQISASFSTDGKYTVCASEDSRVYIWKRDVARSSGGGKGKSWVTTRSREYFYCKDVSVAVPWPSPGSGCEKPTLPSQSSKTLEASTSSSQQSASSSDDPFRFPLPLLPKKSSSEQQLLPPTSPDSLQTSLLGSSPSSHSLLSSVNSSYSFASWRWGGGSSRVAASSPESGDAWGMVVVTADLAGNIRIYQNFGLPVRLSRQSNPF